MGYRGGGGDENPKHPTMNTQPETNFIPDPTEGRRPPPEEAHHPEQGRDEYFTEGRIHRPSPMNPHGD